MSTRSSSRPERRRKPQEVRRDALAVARGLLIAGGPGAITLKAIAAGLEMSHANLIHHFGSAAALHTQLRDLMVHDLTRAMTALLERRDPEAAPSLTLIVDRVFDTYASGGIGMLMAWTAINRRPGDTNEAAAAIGELLAVLGNRLEGPEAPRRAREMVSLVTLLAFAESLIGKALAGTIGSDPASIRALTVRLLASLQGSTD